MCLAIPGTSIEEKSGVRSGRIPFVRHHVIGFLRFGNKIGQAWRVIPLLLETLR